MTRVARLLTSLIGCCALIGCTDDAYVVGAVCPAVPNCGGANSGGASNAGGGSGGNAGAAGTASIPGLSLDFSGSGVERLPKQLLGEGATNLLISTDATASAWPARIGGDFQAAANAKLSPGEPWPFADAGTALAHDNGLALTSSDTWSGSAKGAFALEAVFRAHPGASLLQQLDGTNGLTLSLDSVGNLSLMLASSTQDLHVKSPELVPDAWHHCMIFASSSERVAQMVCNGQPGDLVALPAGFELTAGKTDATIGGAKLAPVHWAELARFEAADFGPSGAWPDLARERFAKLVGTYATASGAPVPYSEVRASGAYIDMSPSDDPALRRLHAVGQDWPRIVCRPTSTEARVCGLLVEASSSQPIAQSDLQLDGWTASGVTLAVADPTGPTGDHSLLAITPIPTSETHTLELSAPFGDGPAVVSLYGRAAAHQRLRIEVAGVTSAVFDLQAPSVIDPGAALVASAEPWGDGLTRVSYSFDVTPGQRVVRLTLLDDAGADTFAGDGKAALYLGNFELRFRSYSTPLPTFGAIQQADRLVYAAGNGNLPASPRLRFGAQIWLPNAPLLADGAIVNANFATHYDQQINLFVASQDNTVRFWGLQGKTTPWQLANSLPVADGLSHDITAEAGAGAAKLDVDGTSRTQAAASFNTSALDRIEIGASVSSSGPLTGILRSVQIEPAP